MNLAKLIVPDINVWVKVSDMRLVWMREIFCLVGRSVWRAHINAANNLILRLPWPLQCGSDAELRCKTKEWNIKEAVEATLQQAAAEAGAARQGQGSAWYFSGGFRVWPVVPWKWSECFVSVLMDAGKKKKETTGSSNLLLLLTIPPSEAMSSE